MNIIAVTDYYILSKLGKILKDASGQPAYSLAIYYLLSYLESLVLAKVV